MQSTQHAPISTDTPHSGLGTSPRRPLGPRPTLPTQRLVAVPLSHDIPEDAWPRTDRGGWQHVRAGRTEPVGSVA
jgi:hypothetical protein